MCDIFKANKTKQKENEKNHNERWKKSYLN